jgi:hypothetical protein
MEEKPRIIVAMNVDHEEFKKGDRYEVDSDRAGDLVRNGFANFSTQEDLTPIKAERKIEGKPEKKEAEPKPTAEPEAKPAPPQTPKK